MVFHLMMSVFKFLSTLHGLICESGNTLHPSHFLQETPPTHHPPKPVSVRCKKTCISALQDYSTLPFQIKV